MNVDLYSPEFRHVGELGRALVTASLRADDQQIFSELVNEAFNECQAQGVRFQLALIAYLAHIAGTAVHLVVRLGMPEGVDPHPDATTVVMSGLVEIMEARIKNAEP